MDSPIVIEKIFFCKFLFSEDCESEGVCMMITEDVCQVKDVQVCKKVPIQCDAHP